MSNGRGIIVQKPLFHRRTDRWTDRQLWWNQYTSTTSLARVYKIIFNVEKSLKNYPPGSQNFMGGVTFSRPVVQNLMLKFEPCQLLTLKNDPGSHFKRWKMTRGVIFQRGHYLMLHRHIISNSSWVHCTNTMHTKVGNALFLHFGERVGVIVVSFCCRNSTVRRACLYAWCIYWRYVMGVTIDELCFGWTREV